MFPEHVERSFLDPECSFVAVGRIFRTTSTKQKFAQLRPSYIRRILPTMFAQLRTRFSCRAAFCHSSCCSLQVTRYIDKCTLLGERIACVVVFLLLSLSYHAIGAATRRFGRMPSKHFWSFVSFCFSVCFVFALLRRTRRNLNGGGGGGGGGRRRGVSLCSARISSRITDWSLDLLADRYI